MESARLGVMGAVVGMELRHAVEGAVTKKNLLFSRAVQRSDGDVSAREAVRFAALGSLGDVWGRNLRIAVLSCFHAAVAVRT